MVFTAIMVVMLLIPVVSDVGDAMGKIFINWFILLQQL
jgi:hypothetical protein